MKRAYVSNTYNGFNNHVHGGVNGFAGNNGGTSTIKVLMFPWLAHGHITPFLELAKRLSKRDITVYLCSTPVNLCSVKEKLDERYSLSIRFVQLHLESSHGFPAHYHTTNGLPPHLMTTLKDALDKARPNFVTILKTLNPDLLIHDFLQPWAGEAALALGIPAVDFISSSATMTSLMYHIFQKRRGNDFPFWSKVMKYHDYQKPCLTSLEEAAARRGRDDMRAIDSIDRSSGIVLIKSFKEIEGKYCDYLSTLSNKKIVPVGPLVQEPTKNDANEQSSLGIIEWLDKKKTGSTVFVSFGSEYFLSKEEREEIAHGLELSSVNFVWVVRFPKGEEIKIDDALPQGFLNRVRGRGMVVEGWAPQARILQHDSIGGFVSHCGWNSVIEGMTFGVPIIAVPMHLDQPINAKIIEEVGVGLEVLRDKKDRLERKEMGNVIDQVVIRERAIFKKRARDMSDLIRSKGEEEIDDVVVELIKLCMKKGLH